MIPGRIRLEILFGSTDETCSTPYIVVVSPSPPLLLLHQHQHTPYLILHQSHRIIPIGLYSSSTSGKHSNVARLIAPIITPHRARARFLSNPAHHTTTHLRRRHGGGHDDGHAPSVHQRHPAETKRMSRIPRSPPRESERDLPHLTMTCSKARRPAARTIRHPSRSWSQRWCLCWSSPSSMSLSSCCFGIV